MSTIRGGDHNFDGQITLLFTVTDDQGAVSLPVDLFITISPVKPPLIINQNIGPLILLSNPTTPLFPESKSNYISLFPFDTQHEFALDRDSLDFIIDLDDIYFTMLLKDQIVTELREFSFSIPTNAVFHSNPNEKLVYSATKSDGTSLPQWLKFDPKQLTFTGTPPKEEHGLEVMVTVRDQSGDSVHAVFRVKVTENRQINHHINHEKHKVSSGKHVGRSHDIFAIAAKRGFNDQLSSSKNSRLMESRALLESLQKLSASSKLN